MRERWGLLSSHRAVLAALVSGPASIEEIGQRTRQAHLEVWLPLARLEARGFVRGQTSEAGGLDTGRLYTLTDSGRTALTENPA